MRRYLVLASVALTLNVYAADTLRVGSQVLVVGDSAVRVQALLGKPMHSSGKRHSGSAAPHSGGSKKTKSRAASAKSFDNGEQWQYRLGDHAAIITIVHGKVARIEESLH